MKHLFTSLLILSLVSCGKDCNCPENFICKDKKCYCPEKYYKIGEKCRKLEKNEYYIPLSDFGCFDTMTIKFNTDTLNCSDCTVVNDTFIYNFFTVNNKRLLKEVNYDIGFYVKKQNGIDSMYCKFIDSCNPIFFDEMLGIKGRKEQGVWKCTLFAYRPQDGPQNPFKEKEVILIQ